MNINDVIVLSAKTHKAKNVLGKMGKTWLIAGISGTKLKVYSIIYKPAKNPNNLPNSVRWIESINDLDFEIVKNFGPLSL